MTHTGHDYSSKTRKHTENNIAPSDILHYISDLLQLFATLQCIFALFAHAFGLAIALRLHLETIVFARFRLRFAFLCLFDEKGERGRECVSKNTSEISLRHNTHTQSLATLTSS